MHTLSGEPGVTTKKLTISTFFLFFCYLQGHSESGKIYKRHINQIIISKELNFKAIVNNRSIYQTT